MACCCFAHACCIRACLWAVDSVRFAGVCARAIWAAVSPIVVWAVIACVLLGQRFARIGVGDALEFPWGIGLCAALGALPLLGDEQK